MRDILSLTRGQPLAGQIRSRRICPSLAAFLKLELFRVYIVSRRRDGVEERIEWNNDVEMDDLHSVGAVGGLPISFLA
ncbi:hypothetical protein EXT49_06710 [Pectobacterium polaris]|nr:hypothetical protein [Pectobacterium polaris]